MAPMSIAAAQTRTVELPEVADPSRLAPKDARELSKLIFQ